MDSQIKLVAVDLDHTILRSDGALSPFTAEVFRRLRRCQIVTCVLTARRKASAEPICGRLACRGAAFYNGAVVSADAAAIALHPLNRQSARRLLSDTGSHPCSVSCEDGVTYTNYQAQHSIQLDSWAQLPEQNLLRVVLYKASPALLARLTAASYPGLRVQQLKDGDIVIGSPMAAKEQALKTLLEYWKISPKEAAAFGDDITDLEFMRLAGTGIAVQNAEAQIKQSADAICGSNDGDGPALWLNKYLLTPFHAEIL